MPLRVLLSAAPVLLRALFFIYPLVNNAAFRAIPCYVFDEGQPTETRWLIADVSVQCFTTWTGGAHDTLYVVAGLAVLLYPIGAWLVCFVLLMRVRKSIRAGHPDELAEAIAFLWKEFHPDFFWWGATLDPCRSPRLFRSVSWISR